MSNTTSPTAKPFKVRFWGARGTMASSTKDTEHYGGNTACVEMRCGDNVLIFDAGSGLRMLGDKLVKEAGRLRNTGKTPQPLNLFFTHCHYDHISGLPFFAPFFDPGLTVNAWSGHLEGEDKTRRMFRDYMKPPFFPVGPEIFAANVDYKDFDPGAVLEPCAGVTVETLELQHHDNCVGYRVNFDGRSVCYITDTTHIPDQLDENILRICQDTDLLIYDGTYTDAEFPQFWNFGHSTWEEGVRIAQQARAKRYCIFHHRPSRTDKAMAKIEKDCRKSFKRSWAAREGLVIKI
ncbi:MAG: MBL fold metallo-hydrolase [Pseudomonadota bacterium]